MRSLFFRHLAQTSDMPLALEISRGEGVFLYDAADKPYLDLISGISVSNLGHSHPKVVAAIKQQAGQYLHTLVYGEYILSPQVQLATLVAGQLPDPLESVYFTNSGAEATEGAMKLAKRFTGRPEIVACRNAYHGSTQGAASLMSETYFTEAFRPLLPGIRHITFNKEADLENITRRTACVIVETVQAEAGIVKPEHDYLSKLRQRCKETGALLVLDEIQAGCGRTGTFFAFEQYGVQPDILLLAKGFGAGMPLGAFISSKEIMQTLTHDPVLGHITTFGGHPLSCAAALAGMQVLLETDYIARVPEKEQLFRKLLVHPAIREVRSAGLLLAMELDSFELVGKVIQYCLQQGLIVDWFLFNNRSIRLAPPLIIGEAQIRSACDILLQALHVCTRND